MLYHKEDDVTITIFSCCHNISTHILTRRMTMEDAEEIPWKTFQLTSSQGGWQEINIIALRAVIISTHILTRRMTRPPVWLYLPLKYFNSHPHKEDDGAKSSTFTLFLIFQFTSSQGGWLEQFDPRIAKSYISTHILTRRMTHFVDYIIW